MAAAFRANALGNDGATTTSSSVPIVIPAGAVAGDYAVAVIALNGTTTTVTTPAGWTLLSGPDTVGTNARGYLFGKTIAGGEPGSTVTFNLSAATRNSGHMAVYSGVTATGLIVGTPAIDDTLDTDLVIPSIGSVPAGAVFHVAIAIHKGTDPPPDFTTPSGYTQGASGRSRTLNTSGAVTAAEAFYKIVGSSGTYGGETATADLAHRAVGYAVVIPEPITAATAALSGGGTLSTTQTPAVARTAGLSGGGTLSTTQTPAVARTAGLSGGGTLSTTQALAVTRAAALSGSGSLASVAVPGWTKTAAYGGSGSLVANALGFASGILFGEGTLTTTQVLAVLRAAAMSGSGTLSAAITGALAAAGLLTGSGTLTATTPATPVGAQLSGAGYLVAHMVQLLRFEDQVVTDLRFSTVRPLRVYYRGVLVWQ